MSDKWILSVQTSLPNYCKNKKDIIRNDQVFDSFEEGKAAFIETLKSYSFSENAMFDGNGRCKEFEDFFGTSSGNWDWLIEADPDDYDEDLQLDTLKGFCDAVRAAFRGEEADISSLNVFDSWPVKISREDDTVFIRDEGGGAFNGINPYIKMNTFDWSEIKPYFLYIDDLFGQDYSAELYMDLLPEDQEIKDPYEEKMEFYHADQEEIELDLEAL